MNILHMSSAAAETVVPTVVARKQTATRRTYHRIREVRLQQGVSLRTAARHLASDIRTARAQDVMHRGPRTIRVEALAVEAAELMEQHGITRLFVVDGQGKIVGALNTNDLMRAKVI